MKQNNMADNTLVKESAGQPDYPGSLQVDEIDLVDLWLLFWAHRKLFFSSAIMIAVLGIVYFEAIYEPKQVSTVRSIIEIQSNVMDGTMVTILSPVSLAKRIEYVDLPEISLAPEYKTIRPYIMATVANPVGETNIIEIVSVVPESATVDVSKFQTQLVEQIYSENKDSSHPLSEYLADKFVSLNKGVSRMQQLMSELDQELRPVANSQGVSNQSFRNQLDSWKNGLAAELNSLSIDIKYLESVASKFEVRILVRGRVSSGSVVINTSKAYTLTFVLAFVLAIFIVIVVAFASKVKDRMAGRG